MYNQYNTQMAFQNGPPQYTNMSAVPPQQVQQPVVPVEQQEPKFSHISFNDFPPQAPFFQEEGRAEAPPFPPPSFLQEELGAVGPLHIEDRCTRVWNRRGHLSTRDPCPGFDSSVRLSRGSVRV